MNWGVCIESLRLFQMENLKLEINSLRFANNVPWEDVLKLSVLAMLSFQQAHTLNDLKKVEFFLVMFQIKAMNGIINMYSIFETS